MKSTTLITLDLQRPNFCTVYAVQDDKLTRWVAAQLTDGGNAWTPPSGALLTIRYRKPDGTAGWYDTLEDGSRAYSISGSVVNFGLAVQSLSVPGTVQAEVSFYTSSGERLTTFLFLIEVEKDPLTDAEIESSDYFSVLTQQVSQAAGSAASAAASAAEAKEYANVATNINISGDGYCKMPDGTLLCWCYTNAENVPFSDQWGDLYYSGAAITFKDWPIPFVRVPYVFASAQGGSEVFIGRVSGSTITNPGSVYAYRAISGSNTVSVSILGIGRWK